MKTNIHTTHEHRTKAVGETAVFMPRPDRLVEWLGGVTNDNLYNVLGSVKELLIENPLDEIQLLITSPGGPTGIAMSFYDAMTGWLKPNLTTIGSGDVDSSGIIILLSGKKRYLTPNTTMLLHLAGRTLDQAKRYNSAEMASMVSEDKLKDYQYACVVANATEKKFTPEKILELMARNTILTPDEAVNMGLAQKVLR